MWRVHMQTSELFPCFPSVRPGEGVPGRRNSTCRGRERNRSFLHGFPYNREAGEPPFSMTFCPWTPPSSPQPFSGPRATSPTLRQEGGSDETTNKPSVAHPCFQQPSLGFQSGIQSESSWKQLGVTDSVGAPAVPFLKPLPAVPWADSGPWFLLHQALTGGTFVAEPGVGGPSSLGSDEPLGSMSFPEREQRG